LVLHETQQLRTPALRFWRTPYLSGLRELPDVFGALRASGEMLFHQHVADILVIGKVISELAGPREPESA
jgi:hypothetical protein